MSAILQVHTHIHSLAGYEGVKLLRSIPVVLMEMNYGPWEGVQFDMRILADYRSTEQYISLNTRQKAFDALREEIVKRYRWLSECARLEMLLVDPHGARQWSVMQEFIGDA